MARTLLPRVRHNSSGTRRICAAAFPCVLVTLYANPHTPSETMNIHHPDANAELQPGFEPLRIGFALLALLLGTLAAMQF